MKGPRVDNGRQGRWIHEWERLRGLGEEEKDGAEEEGMFVADGAQDGLQRYSWGSSRT